MNRRRFLASGISGVIVGVGGCTGGSDHQPPDPKDLPDQPSTLNSESVEAYVREYEEVHQHNTSITPSTRGIHPNCSTVVDHEGDDAIYVSTVCYVNHPKVDSAGHWTSFPTLYRVTTDETIRIEPTEIEHDEPYLSGGRKATDTYGIWLSNFDDQPQKIALRLVHHDTEQTTVLDETFDLDAEHGIYISKVTAIVGEYEFRGELSTGETTTETLVLAKDAGQFPYQPDPFYAVHATPDGTIESREIYFERPA